MDYFATAVSSTTPYPHTPSASKTTSSPRIYTPTHLRSSSSSSSAAASTIQSLDAISPTPLSSPNMSYHRPPLLQSLGSPPPLWHPTTGISGAGAHCERPILPAARSHRATSGRPTPTSGHPGGGSPMSQLATSLSMVGPMASPGKHSPPSPIFSTSMPGPSPPKRLQSSTPFSSPSSFGSVAHSSFSLSGTAVVSPGKTPSAAHSALAFATSSPEAAPRPNPSSPNLARQPGTSGASDRPSRLSGPLALAPSHTPATPLRPAPVLSSPTSPSSSALSRATHHSSTPMTNGNNAPSLIPVKPAQLVDWIRNEDAKTLVLDMRSPTLNRQARVVGSVSISVPSTLIRRPMYGIERIEGTIECPRERARFGRFRTAQVDPANATTMTKMELPTAGPSTRIERIVIYDNDASSKGALPPSHPMALMLAKFHTANIKAQLGHVVGGFSAICAVPRSEDVIERPCDTSWSDTSDASMSPIESSHSSARSSSQGAAVRSGTGRMTLALPTPSILAPMPLQTSRPVWEGNTPAPQCVATPMATPFFGGLGRLPQAAFTQASVDVPNVHASGGGSNTSSNNNTFGRGKEWGLGRTDVESLMHQRLKLGDASTVNGSTLLPSSSSSLWLAGGHDGGNPTSSGAASACAGRQGSACANPFFNNIRQLTERLDLEQSLLNLPPLLLPQPTPEDTAKLPEWVKELLKEAPEQRAKRLAHEFYDLEAAEMRRLQDVMSWHANSSSHATTTQPTQIGMGQSLESGDDAHDKAEEHPFSISAGVELGHKNRYRNIWPWEHARVRLTDTYSGGTDYVNASLIRLRGTPKQYIATQGPLNSTFSDFWQVVAQQDVGVIVMLTKHCEQGREKCGDYLRSGIHGNIQVEIEGGTRAHDGDSDATQSPNDFFGFVNHDKAEETDGDAMVVKKVMLRRLDQPNWPVRHVRHIQYRCWPDFDVPPQADEVLDLIQVCNEQEEEVKRINADRPEGLGRGLGPVLVHCSAGVGRTGSYILIDALLDVLRRRRQHREQPYSRPHTAHTSILSNTMMMEGDYTASPAESAGSSGPSSVSGASYSSLSSSTVPMGGSRTSERQRHDTPATEVDDESDGQGGTQSGPHDARGCRSKGESESRSRSSGSMACSCNTRSRSSSGCGLGACQRECSLPTPSLLSSSSSSSSSPLSCLPLLLAPLDQDISMIDIGRQRQETRARSAPEPSRASSVDSSGGDGADDGQSVRVRRSESTSHVDGTSSNAGSRSGTTTPTTKLPNHFETAWCDMKMTESVPPLCQDHPILPTVNEMREQRMSMVANYRQYVYVHEAILTGLMRDLDISAPTLG